MKGADLVLAFERDGKGKPLTLVPHPGTAADSGALIDVETGRMVLSVSADSRGRKNSPRVAVEADEIKLVEKLRNEAIVKLAEQLRTQVKQQSAG